MFKTLLLFLLGQISLQYRFVSGGTVITRYHAQPFWTEDEIEQNADTLDWSKHPCKRSCMDDEPPKTCFYSFHIEQYYTMSKACYDCPYNRTDCFRPHCISADGVQRSVIVVNRQMPGPAVEVCEGDRVVVDVTNMMHADSTTVHWHGQHMRSNPYMDGTPFVSQCPIPCGNTFRYDFIAEDPGTHFWHSHVGFQRGDGMFGALVVRRQPKRDQLLNLYDYDEHTVIVSDWDHQLGLDKFLAHFYSSGNNKPPSLLINGLGSFETLPSRDNISGIMPTEIFNVKPNSKYRFRLINAGFLNCPIEFSIDGHSIWVVSSDGKDLEPVEAKSLVSYAGERYDVIVEMNKEVNNYWVRFRGLLDCGEKFGKVHQVAILRYEGAPDEDPEGNVGYEIPSPEENKLQVNALNKGMETKDVLTIPNLEALDKDDITNTRTPDHKFYISYDFYGKDNHQFHRKDLYGFQQVKQKVGTPQLNHISMKNPAFPLMSQTELIDSSMFCNSSTAKGCDIDYCSCPHVLQVELDSVVELILIDEGVPYDANHPFHLHGNNFRVIGMERMGSNVTLEDVQKADLEGRICRKLERAPIKDTVTVPDGGYTVIRFHANNPGYWLFHCHIEFHSEVGMALVFKVGEHEDFVQVPPDFPRCGHYSADSRSTRTTKKPDIEDPEDPEHEHENITDLTENDINHHVDEKVRTSIANWLPLILSELRAASGASASSLNPIMSTALAILACLSSHAVSRLVFACLS